MLLAQLYLQPRSGYCLIASRQAADCLQFDIMGSSKPRFHWKEAELVVHGSELEWQIKKANSDSIWRGAGKREGTEIWRIVKFKVTPWPRKDYGKFHVADSYIVLHSHRMHELTQVLTHNIHFWIGKDSTPDKHGTAAYKTVELYNYLDGIGSQHREAQGEESKKFKSYFDQIVILPGGSESGFNHVEPEQYKHRLLHFKGTTNNIRVTEVSLQWKSLNSGDVFVLDLGLHVIQWNGKESNKDERHGANRFVKALESNRGGRPEVETLEEVHASKSASHVFHQMVSPRASIKSKEIKSAEMGGDDRAVKAFPKELYRISEKRKGGISFKRIAQGTITKQHLDSKHAYVLDTGFHVFFWVGKEASSQVRSRGFAQAKEYVNRGKHSFLPLTRLDHRQHDAEFEAAFDVEYTHKSAPVANKRRQNASCTIL